MLSRSGFSPCCSEQLLVVEELALREDLVDHVLGHVQRHVTFGDKKRREIVGDHLDVALDVDAISVIVAEVDDVQRGATVQE